MSARGFAEPLSAQAHAPNRPSGAAKKEVQNEDSGRPGPIGPRSDRAIIAADRHLYPRRRVPKVAENGKWSVNRGERQRGVLADLQGQGQARIRSASLPELLTAPCAPSAPRSTARA